MHEVQKHGALMRRKHYPGEFEKTLCGHDCTKHEWAKLKFNKKEQINCHRCKVMLDEVDYLRRKDKDKLIQKYYGKSKYWKDRLIKGNSIKGTEHQNGRPGGEYNGYE
jgi:hypothetical protein